MSSEPKPGRRAGPCIGKPSLQRWTEGISCVFERPGCENTHPSGRWWQTSLPPGPETWWFSSSASWTSLCRGKNSNAVDPERLKNPRSMSDCGISSIAPFCRREESYSCRTEALEALFTTVSWNPIEAGGIFPKLKCVAGPNREQRHPPPRRRALGVLVRVDGVWSAGLTGGQHGVRTLQGRINCVPTHAAHRRRKDRL